MKYLWDLGGWVRVLQVLLSQETLDNIAVLFCISSLNLDKLLDLPNLYNRNDDYGDDDEDHIFFHTVIAKIKWDRMCKAFITELAHSTVPYRILSQQKEFVLRKILWETILLIFLHEVNGLS